MQAKAHNWYNPKVAILNFFALISFFVSFKLETNQVCHCKYVSWGGD